MAKHHYLPATFLAGFSADQRTSPRRKRRLWIGDLQEGRKFSTTAENVAAIGNLYTLVETQADPDLIEQVWTGYEGRLDQAIDLLGSGRLDAKTWIRVLVPLVAGMLVRGPDFDRRFEQRLRALGLDPAGEYVSADNVNGARLLELQRLLGPVAVADWTVVRVTGGEPLITNDLGYALFKYRGTSDFGIAIPLNRYFVLNIVPKMEREVVRADSGTWVPIMGYTVNPPTDQENLNQATSSLAQRFIFGPDGANR